MTDADIILAHVGEMAELLKVIVRDMQAEKRVAFLALVRELISDYCPRCGEAFKEGCVCTR